MAKIIERMINVSIQYLLLCNLAQIGTKPNGLGWQNKPSQQLSGSSLQFTFSSLHWSDSEASTVKNIKKYCIIIEWF